MASEVAICNRALAAIGSQSSISSLTEGTPEANACALIFADTRDEVQNMAFWNFCRKTATLGLIKSAPGTLTNPTGAAVWSSAYPSPPWLYEYAYPSDCLQMRFIVPQLDNDALSIPIFSSSQVSYNSGFGPPVPFLAAVDDDSNGNQINVILTNQYQAIGVYTRRIINTQIFSQQFTEALVCALGAKLAMPLTGDKTLVNNMYKLANDKISDARASDGNEGLTMITQEAEWLMARDSYVGPELGYYISPYNSLYAVW